MYRAIPIAKKVNLIYNTTQPGATMPNCQIGLKTQLPNQTYWSKSNISYSLYENYTFGDKFENNSSVL